MSVSNAKETITKEDSGASPLFVRFGAEPSALGVRLGNEVSIGEAITAKLKLNQN